MFSQGVMSRKASYNRGLSPIKVQVPRLGGTAVAQWLRRCATNRKVADSIPGGVIGIFH